MALARRPPLTGSPGRRRAPFARAVPPVATLFRYRPGDTIDTFSRNSTATYRDSSGTLKTAASGVARDDHYARDSGGSLVRSLWVERAGKNSVLKSEALGGAEWSGAATVTDDDAAAPDGNTTADLLDDTDGAATQDRNQALTVSDDSLNRSGSCFIKKTSGASVFPALELAYSGGTTAVTYRVQLNPNDGSTDDTTATSPKRAGVEDWNSDYYRLWIVGANNGTGNTTLTIRAIPASTTTLGSTEAGATGSHHFWGAQLEGLSGGAGAPSSYIPTTTAAVSRSADTVEFTGDFGAQELSAYVKDVVASPGADPVVLNVGDAANTTAEPRFTMKESKGNKFNTIWEDSTGTTSQAANTTDLSFGNVAELLGLLYDNGDVEAKVSINGGSVSATGRSGGAASPSGDFNGDDVAVGPLSRGSHQIIAIQIEPGVKTMDEMRTAAGTA